jgi:spore maturation protein CgeB
MIRFFVASSVYPQHCRWFESQNANLSELPYARIVQLFGAEGCGWGESWRSALERTGQYQVFVSYYSWESAQKVWAREQGVRPQPETWMADILTAQIDAFKPEVLFINGWHLGASYIQALRLRFPGLQKVVGYDGIAHHNSALFRGTDIVLAPLKETAAFYEARGLIGHLFKRGFDDGILGLLEKRTPTIPASFAGSVSIGEHQHNERLRLLHHVSRRCPLQLFLLMQPVSQLPRILASNIVHARVAGWRSLINDVNAYWALSRARQAPVFGKQMYQTLADSEVSLNCHIDAAGVNAGNMRLFEATGVGSCLLTDWKSNLRDFFEPDREVVTFRSPDECVDKLKFLLQNSKQREAIARAGQQRTLKDHNVRTEITRFAETLAHIL